MQTYEILVRNRAIVGNSVDMTLVRTSVGMDQVHILFDNAEWLEFPVTITFAQGDDVVSQSLVISETGGGDWVAESTVAVPHEVIDMVGRIRVTLQGTDSDGRHIITAYGAPLYVEESGDVMLGDVPSDAPTVDQWHQAYADAMEAVNQAASLVSSLQSQLESMVETASQSLDERLSAGIATATTSTIGGVIVGDNLSIDDEGVLSAVIPAQESSGGTGLTVDQANALLNLRVLAAYAFDTEFGDDGIVKDTVTVKRKSLPKASDGLVGMVTADGRTTTVDEFGVMRAVPYTLPAATTDALGGVRPDGETIQNASGVISGRVATAELLGMVKPDGVTITVSEDGTITASGSGGEGGYVLPVASASQLGGVKVDGTTIGISDGVISVIIESADEEGF